MCSTASTNAQPTQPRKYIAFRDDDVAPFTSLEPLEAVNQVHIDEGVPVTLGIIPHPPREGQEGNELLQDGPFHTYMGSIASNPLFEFAQHGYTHQDIAPSPEGPSEFYGRPYAAQYNAIKQGRDDITQAFGVTPTSFLPPFDKSDNNTLKAAQALGFTEYSTAFVDVNMNQGYKEGIKVDTISIELGNNSLQSLENATEQWLNNPNSINTFIVLYHPSDFKAVDGTVNATELKLLGDYIDYLQGTGRVQFTTLDRSVTTTGNAAVASSSSNGTTAVGATDATNGVADVPVLGAILAFSLAAIFTIRLRTNKNSRKR